MNPKQVELNKKIERKNQQEADDLQFIMNTPQGRRFFIRLLSKCGYETNAFTGNSNTFFNEGKQFIALSLIEDLYRLGKIGLELKHKAEIEHLENQLDQ